MPPASSSASFPHTRWSLLHRVRAGTQEEARSALETLCRAYWQPLYCVARWKQLNEHDAKDAVQGFFECMLRRETFAKADETLGKLRHLLLRAFDNYCSQQWQKAKRQKRGGGAEHLELSEWIGTQQAEQRYLKSDAAGTSIETLYNREWAHSVLERSLQALREDYAKRGWSDRYELLVGPLLHREDSGSLEQIAASAGATAGALRVNLHRMRVHYRGKIERELAATLDTDDSSLIRAEMGELFKAFA